MYSAKQTLKILKNINKKTKVIISIFAGSGMADVEKDPILIIYIYIFQKNIKMEIL